MKFENIEDQFDVNVEHVEAVLDKLDELKTGPEQQIGTLLVALSTLLTPYDEEDIDLVVGAIRELASSGVVIEGR